VRDNTVRLTKPSPDVSIIELSGLPTTTRFTDGGGVKSVSCIFPSTRFVRIAWSVDFMLRLMKFIIKFLRKMVVLTRKIIYVRFVNPVIPKLGKPVLVDRP
jgi:hypothetical protein